MMPRRRDNTSHAARRSRSLEALLRILTNILSTRSWGAWLAATRQQFAELKELLPDFVDHLWTHDEQQDIIPLLGCVLTTGMRMMCSSASGSSGSHRRRLLEGPSHGCPAVKCIELLVDWFSYISLQVADADHAAFIAEFTSPSMLKLSGVVDCLAFAGSLFFWLVHANTRTCIRHHHI
jgi:hypothetical protein